ncbi:MAG: type II toxin-antitoxin system RelE family toxin [Pyramidobacter sp.]|jgi:mRNA interferase RelE/StbE
MYRVVFTKQFEKKFEKLDKQAQRLIKNWLENNLINCADPRAHGKALTANLKGYWRYRIADYRLIAEIQDDRLTVFAITVSHRRDVYKNQF